MGTAAPATARGAGVGSTALSKATADLSLWGYGIIDAMTMDDPRANLPNADAQADDRWRAVLSGDTKHTPRLVRLRRIFRHLPSDPRCKVCYAPYAAPFGPIVGMLGFGRWDKNPSLCGSCMRIMERMQGGAEVELSMLFADLRGSTELAAGMSGSDYRQLLNAFYAIASRAVEGRDGSIDKYLGDGVFALFIPGFAGSDHAAAAIDAARQILRETVEAVEPEATAIPLKMGIGVNTGIAYVGVVGRSGDLTDFTAVGDAVNMTQRLSSVAAAHELLISDAALAASGLRHEGLTRRDLDMKGIANPVTAWSEVATPGRDP
jgi:adenylate cyclase